MNFLFLMFSVKILFPRTSETEHVLYSNFANFRNFWNFSSKSPKIESILKRNEYAQFGNKIYCMVNTVMVIFGNYYFGCLLVGVVILLNNFWWFFKSIHFCSIKNRKTISNTHYSAFSAFDLKIYIWKLLYKKYYLKIIRLCLELSAILNLSKKFQSAQ